MKPSAKSGTPVIFKFLRTLADHLEGLRPPYTDVQKIIIKKIHVDSGGHVQDYEAVVEGTRDGQLKAGGDTLQHREDCPWS